MFNIMKKISAGVLASAIGAATLVPIKAFAFEPFIGQIIMFGGNFCPRGFAGADGQLLAISGNEALFSILGTTYGGDGRTTFGLPDLRGRSPVHAGSGPGLGSVVLGEKSGRETVTLTQNEMPSHSHELTLNNRPAVNGGGHRKAFGANGDAPNFNTEANDRSMRTDAITNTGGGQAFNIRNPYQAITMCVALTGIFPPRS